MITQYYLILEQTDAWRVVYSSELFHFNAIQLSDNIGYAEAWKDVKVQCNAIQGNEMQFCDKGGSVGAQKAVNEQCNAVQFNIQCNRSL